MANTELAVDPRVEVRRFRQTYVNAHALRSKQPTVFPGAQITTPRETPIVEADLPEGMRSLLTEYRRNHPQSKVIFLKYQRIENGNAVKIIEDESGLPDEDALLQLSQTITLTTSTEVRVITEILVASIAAA
jgi:hypothetical protein